MTVRETIAAAPGKAGQAVERVTLPDHPAVLDLVARLKPDRKAEKMPWCYQFPSTRPGSPARSAAVRRVAGVWDSGGVHERSDADIGVVELPRHSPGGPLLYPELAQCYLDAAARVAEDPSPEHCQQAEHAAFFLACRYDGMSVLEIGLRGLTAEGKVAVRLHERVRTYRALRLSAPSAP